MIRLATRKDLPQIYSVYSRAREYMKEQGNPDQWGDSYPEIELLDEDIEQNLLYVIEEENEIVGAFVFFVGDDPTYHWIDGAWLNEKPYGVIHRIAGSASGKQVLHKAVEFGFTKAETIRIDTHENNKPMRTALQKEGFVETGIIICHNGTPRVAYQK